MLRTNVEDMNEIDVEMTRNIKVITEQISKLGKIQNLTVSEELKYRRLIDLVGSSTWILKLLIDRFGREYFSGTLSYYETMKHWIEQEKLPVALEEKIGYFYEFVEM